MAQKRLTIYLLPILVVILGVGLYWTLIPSPVLEPPPAQKAKADPELAPYLPEIEKIKQVMKTDPKKAEAMSEALLEKLPEKYQRYYDFGFKAGMEKIDFYGQIVDQHGDPVVNATVGYRTGGAFLAPGKGIGIVTTDDEGRFEIHSEGGSLTLSGVKAPGIDFQYPAPNYKNSIFDARTTTMIFYGHQQTVGGGYNLWTDTSKEKPYVFTAWRVDQYDLVKTGWTKAFIKHNSEIYTLDFDKDWRKQSIEGIVKGHLRLTCDRGEMKNLQDQVDWKVTLTPVDGGIQPTDDLYLNQAPATGYQPSFTIEMKRGSPDYKTSLMNQRFFFTAKNGQIYGSLYTHIEPHSKLDMCAIRVTYKINSNGSYNLAVKPR